MKRRPGSCNAAEAPDESPGEARRLRCYQTLEGRSCSGPQVMAEVSARNLGAIVGIGLFDLLLRLVAKAGTGSSSDGAANDGSRRSCHGTTEERTTNSARAAANASTGLIVAIHGLTGNCAADSTDNAAHGGTDRAADDSPDARAGKRARAGPRDLRRVLFVLRGGAIPGPIVGPADLVVVMAHFEPPSAKSSHTPRVRSRPTATYEGGTHGGAIGSALGIASASRRAVAVPARTASAARPLTARRERCPGWLTAPGRDRANADLCALREQAAKRSRLPINRLAICEANDTLTAGLALDAHDAVTQTRRD
jgi:hypothetical protein